MYRSKKGMKTQEKYPAAEKSCQRRTKRLLYICYIARQQKWSWLQVFLYHNFSEAVQSCCILIPSLFLYILQAHP